MVPLLHHLRRQPLFLYVLSEVLAIMMGSTRMERRQPMQPFIQE